MKKNTIFFASALFLIAILSLGLTSAYSFFDYSESWFYSENLVGENRGFSLTYETSIPQSDSYDSVSNDPYDWSYEGYNNRRANQRDLYFYNSAKDRYDADQALQSAFRTYQGNSNNQFELQQQREQNRNRYRGYSSFGHSPRYYSWGF